jgi:flavorubredoxin
MKKILVIYHSQTGNTEAMAKAIAEGGKGAGATVTLKKAADAGVDDLLNCDAVVIGTPNYFSYMAGMVKDFFDRVWGEARGQLENKPYAVFGSYGGGELPAIESVEKICEGLGMKKMYESIGAQRTPTAENLKACRELGKKLAKL